MKSDGRQSRRAKAKSGKVAKTILLSKLKGAFPLQIMFRFRCVKIPIINRSPKNLLKKYVNCLTSVFDSDIILYNMKNATKNKVKFTTKAIAYAAAGTALVTAATLAGLSTPQFYFNLGDAVILIISALFGPIIGGLAGGLGSFFADLAVYPATMFYTLVIKGTEGFLAGLFLSLIRKKISKKTVLWSLNAVVLAFCAYFMMLGYFICQTYIYGTLATALIALPMDAVQASSSFVIAFIILYPCKLINLRKVFSLQSKGNDQTK